MTAPLPTRPQPVERFYLIAIVFYVLLAAAFAIRYLGGDHQAIAMPATSDESDTLTNGRH